MKARHIFVALIATALSIQPALAANEVTVRGYIESTTGGFVFPDGTIQETAAVQSEAWPLYCYHSGVLDTNETLDLTCYSHLPNPHGAWGASSGVPEGYYFLVTDVLIQPRGSGTATTVRLRHECPTGVALSRGFTVGSDETKSYNFRSPTIHLTPGHWLSVFNSSGFAVEVDVMGWLTTDPELILH